MILRVSVIWRWFDLWVGAYWDRGSRTLYLLPIPTLGLRIAFGRAQAVTG